MFFVPYQDRPLSTCLIIFWMLASQSLAQEGTELAVLGRGKPNSEVAMRLSSYVEGWLLQDEMHIPEWTIKQVGDFGTALKVQENVDINSRRLEALTNDLPKDSVRAYSINVKALARRLMLIEALDEYYLDSPPLLPRLLKSLATDVENLEIFITENGRDSAAIQLDFELGEIGSRKLASALPLSNNIASSGETGLKSLLLNFQDNSLFNAVGEWNDIYYQKSENLCETLELIDESSPENDLLANTFGRLTGRVLLIESSNSSIIIGFEHRQEDLFKMKSSLSELLEAHFLLKKLNWRTVGNRDNSFGVEFNENFVVVDKQFVYFSLDQEIGSALKEFRALYEQTKFGSGGAAARAKIPIPSIFELSIDRELVLKIDELREVETYFPIIRFGECNISNMVDVSVFMVNANSFRIIIEFSIGRD